MDSSWTPLLQRKPSFIKGWKYRNITKCASAAHISKRIFRAHILYYTSPPPMRKVGNRCEVRKSNFSYKNFAKLIHWKWLMGLRMRTFIRKMYPIPKLIKGKYKWFRWNISNYGEKLQYWFLCDNESIYNCMGSNCYIKKVTVVTRWDLLQTSPPPIFVSYVRSKGRNGCHVIWTIY